MDASLILFDLGDTLVRNSSVSAGAMADWPVLEALPGAQPALQALAAGHTLVVASGAHDSSGQQVLRALQRVGLDSYIKQAFTSRDLGLFKTDTRFYPAILAALNCEPGAALMVGDSYPVDVIQAQRSDLQAIWFNPKKAAVALLPPLQNEEVTALEDLPAVIAAPALPDIPTCQAWQREVAMPANIVAHSQVVAGAAYWLAIWLRQAGERVDPILAHRGGLLHDLDKISTLHTGTHGQVTYRFLVDHGQAALGEMALRHNLSAINDPELCPRTWEDKLVFYADKLVEGHHVVPFLERCKALRQRYPQHLADIDGSIPAVLQFEASLCGLVKRTPEALVKELSDNIEQ